MKTFSIHLVLILLVVCGCGGKPAGQQNSLIAVHRLQLDPLAGPVELRPENIDSPWNVKSQRKWKYIVIHHSATDNGNAGIFDKLHRQRDFDELGYHFVITNGSGGKDGMIEAGPRWRKQKWGAHAGGTAGNEYNNYGIGICLVGNFTDHQPSQKQIDSLKTLVSWLMNRYCIPSGNVITHRDVPNAKTACPGDKFYSFIKKYDW